MAEDEEDGGSGQVGDARHLFPTSSGERSVILDHPRFSNHSAVEVGVTESLRPKKFMEKVRLVGEGRPGFEGGMHSKFHEWVFDGTTGSAVRFIGGVGKSLLSRLGLGRRG